MFDYDVIVVGGGPAGLTTGLELSRAGHRTLLLERHVYGGNLQHVERVEEGVSGADLASTLAERAAAAGLRMREAVVTGIEAFSGTRWVGCADGQGWSAAVVVVATGTRTRKLGIPGEDRLLGRGVIDCVPCDGALFRGRTVAVCGSDDFALADAEHLRRLDVRVIDLLATLQEIHGTDRVEAITYIDASGRRETLAVDGVVIRAGCEPNSGFLMGAVELDPDGRVITTAGLDTSAPAVLAAGDVRAGARGLVAAAVRDGTAAASRARELLARDS